MTVGDRASPPDASSLSPSDDPSERTEAFESIDRLTRLARTMSGVPVALAVVVEADRQVFISQQGLAEPWASRGQTPLSHSFCQHVVASDGALVVADARADERLKSNLAIEALGVVAYAGFPLRAGGVCVGSFCLIDTEPRTWSERDLTIGADLAEAASDALALRRAVADQDRALSALRDSDLRYRSLIAAMSDGVVLQSSDGAILECNEAAEEILGLTTDQMMGRTSLDPTWRSVHSDGSDFPGVDHPAMSTLRTGLGCRDVTMGVHKPSGEVTWISIASEPILADDLALPQAVVCSFKDITQQREVSLALESSEQAARVAAETLQAVLNAARQAAVVATDATAVVTVFNAGAERLLGISAATVVGRPITDLIERHGHFRLLDPKHAGRPILSTLLDAAGAEPPQLLEGRFRTSTGELVDLALSTDRILGVGGVVEGYVAVGHDITERQRLADELLVESRRLTRANAELADYAYVVSHDLSEPLRAISGFAELLAAHEAERPDPDRARYVGHITGGVARMKSLIDALLEYARADDGKLNATVTDLGQLVGEVREALAVLITERGARVDCSKLPSVVGDATLLRQVLQNLVANAIKFSDGPEPEVKISARRRPGSWEILVRDSGIGIEPRHRERIFRPFQRLNKRDQYAGSGIGLSICRRIVERHDGAIWVADPDDDGPGCVFHFSVPDREPASVPPA